MVPWYPTILPLPIPVHLHLLTTGNYFLRAWGWRFPSLRSLSTEIIGLSPLPCSLERSYAHRSPNKTFPISIPKFFFISEHAVQSTTWALRVSLFPSLEYKALWRHFTSLFSLLMPLFKSTRKELVKIVKIHCFTILRAEVGKWGISTTGYIWWLQKGIDCWLFVSLLPDIDWKSLVFLAQWKY